MFQGTQDDIKVLSWNCWKEVFQTTEEYVQRHRGMRKNVTLGKLKNIPGIERVEYYRVEQWNRSQTMRSKERFHAGLINTKQTKNLNEWHNQIFARKIILEKLRRLNRRGERLETRSTGTVTEIVQSILKCKYKLG